MDDDYEPQEAIITEEEKRQKATIKAWIDIYIYKVMTDEDKVKYISTTEKKPLADIFKYISKNKSKANEIFGKIEEELLLRIYLKCCIHRCIYIFMLALIAMVLSIRGSIVNNILID